MGDFVPDGINPFNLSRDFLITVRLYYVNFNNIITPLWVKIEVLSKTNYHIKILQNGLNIIWGLIKNTKGQSKTFSLIKNGVNTNVFQEISEHIENALDKAEILSLENQNAINKNNNNNLNLIRPNNNIENRIEESNKQ